MRLLAAEACATDAALDRTLEFPASDFETTVPPDTYDILVYVDGEQELSCEWEITCCANRLHLVGRVWRRGHQRRHERLSIDPD